MNTEEKARKLFRNGYNCAQSTFCAFSDVLDMDFETALKLTSSFGGGMGRLREVCGAVSAMFMIAGLKSGYTSNNDDLAKEKHYALIQMLAKQFEEKHGSIICRELLGLDIKHDTPKPSKRDEKYYTERPCETFIASAAKIINDDILKNNNKNLKY